MQGLPWRRDLIYSVDHMGADFLGGLYATLDRLEAKGYLLSWFADPTPRRGGRSKRYFKLLPAGEQALIRYKGMLDRMWLGVRLEGQENV